MQTTRRGFVGRAIALFASVIPLGFRSSKRKLWRTQGDSRARPHPKHVTGPAWCSCGRTFATLEEWREHIKGVGPERHSCVFDSGPELQRYVSEQPDTAFPFPICRFRVIDPHGGRRRARRKTTRCQTIQRLKKSETSIG